MSRLQMINYGTVFLIMDPVDQSSMVVTFMLYCSFSGESSRSTSGLLVFPVMGNCHAPCSGHSGLPPGCCMCSAPPSSQSISSGRQQGLLRHWCFHVDKKDHITERGGYKVSLKNCFWGFANLILITCTSQIQKVILQWQFMAGLNVKWCFCGISYQFRKMGCFEYSFSHAVVDI